MSQETKITKYITYKQYSEMYRCSYRTVLRKVKNKELIIENINGKNLIVIHEEPKIYFEKKQYPFLQELLKKRPYNNKIKSSELNVNQGFKTIIINWKINPKSSEIEDLKQLIFKPFMSLPYGLYPRYYNDSQFHENKSKTEILMSDVRLRNIIDGMYEPKFDCDTNIRGLKLEFYDVPQSIYNNGIESIIDDYYKTFGFLTDKILIGNGTSGNFVWM